jgi:uncharacterized protein (DUF983 family)
MGHGYRKVVTACPSCFEEYEASRPAGVPGWLFLLALLFPPLLVVILVLYILGYVE